MEKITIETILRNFSSISFVYVCVLTFICGVITSSQSIAFVYMVVGLIVVSVADKMIKKTLQDDQV